MLSLRNTPCTIIRRAENELKKLPKGLLHLEAGIQSLREPVLQKSRRMGSLEDSLQGLRFLCSLPNMETHADLIAGLPLYRLSEIFEDVRTLAGYNAGEIQLESLKLLPGTEMRRRAEELGIRYSPLPPYEVLQTNEISVNELQTARQLSRLLDGFYNTTAWQAITRKLILDDNDFLRRFLEFLIDKNLIDQPMSLEKRGLVLYEFCSMHYPAYKIMVTIAWIEAGMSLKKKPAEKVKTKRQMPPEYWEVIYGNYKESLRLCFLPIDDNTQNGYWFGFESEIQKAEPVFKAKGIMERYQIHNHRRLTQIKVLDYQKFYSNLCNLRRVMPSFLLLSAVEILLDQFQHLLRTVLYLCTQGSILVRTQFGNNPINHCRTEHMILLKDSTLSFQTIGRSGTTVRKLFQLFQLIFIFFLVDIYIDICFFCNS